MLLQQRCLALQLIQDTQANSHHSPVSPYSSSSSSNSNSSGDTPTPTNALPLPEHTHTRTSVSDHQDGYLLFLVNVLKGLNGAV